MTNQFVPFLRFQSLILVNAAKSAGFPMTREALEELIEAHQSELFRYLRFIGADYPVAEDLVQETFLGAFKSKSAPALGDYRGRRAWLRRIAHNRFIDHCRRHKRSPVSFSSAEADSAEAFWKNDFFQHDEGFGCMEALEHCLQKLTGRQRGLIDAFYAARRSRDDIASSLGISPDGVKMALRRIRRTLGECIEKQLSEA